MATTATRTVLGPLTTFFTPDPTCVTPMAGSCDQTLCHAWAGQTCHLSSDSFTVFDQTACWPPVTKGVDMPAIEALNGWGLYSPGLSCPDGHVRACTKTGGDVEGFAFQFPPTAGETAVGCCPSSYACSRAGGPRSAQTCMRIMTKASYPVVSCGGTISPGTTAASRTASGATFHVLVAPMIQMNWQASDLPGAATTTPSQSATTGTGPTTGTTEAPAPSGLSTGAEVGIGVGAAVAGLLLLGGAVYLILSRRRRSRGQNETTGVAGDQPKTGDGGGQQQQQQQQPNRNIVYEMGQTPRAHELG
ncbi:hypothetical protein PG997_006958 [Apiospora hydei]|uniref:Uncharacterized protein n=1 Tax=Apiospora hydei TaxID=1337664 RepID=A0ABR1WRF3_9PEZI